MPKSKLATNFEPYKKTLLGIGPIIFRHVFLLVNGVIFTVVVLLYIFNNKEAAIFLGIIIAFNICLGIIQDTRARIALEALQLLTALRVIRINQDGSETLILSELVEKGDHVRLRLGDQVPCDGVLLFEDGLEVSQALVTGESDSSPRAKGSKVEAGDVVTAGTGILDVQSAFRDSKIYKMMEEAKKYSASPSPIQQAINKVIKYTGYMLLAVIVFVVCRGLITHEAAVKIVLNVGALASTIIPQGLVVITTLLFAFGASSYSKRNVLFQEINATEKLGRIKNLCLDKTGTLTENFLTVEDLYIREGISREEAFWLTDMYILGSGDSSQTIVAVKKHIGEQSVKSSSNVVTDNSSHNSKILGALPFSSWRQYGVVEVDSHDSGQAGIRTSVFVGPPDIFLAYISDSGDKKWLENILAKYKGSGKRLLCVAKSSYRVEQKSGLPDRDLPRELTGIDLSVVSIFVLQSALREGISKAIKFFQDRGIHLRIISGDNMDTVQTVAASAGVKNTGAAVTGKDIERWLDEEKRGISNFDKKVGENTIFARIIPEQKVKIIESLKKNGFTAMVGDGANDVLAIKKADLGIAMFDGVSAARRLAGVILMKNSFTDLPGAVELADNFIRNIEIFAGIFINQSFLGLFFFILISSFGYPYPLTPLNITLINYFAVGIPGMLIGYWAIRPSGKILPASTESFLSKVLPFVIWCSIIEAIGVAVVFALSPTYLKLAGSNTLVALAFIVCGFIFFALAPKVYRGVQTNKEKLHLLYLAIFEIVALLILLKIPLIVRFFDVTKPFPSFMEILIALGVLLVFGLVQYFVMIKFIAKQEKLEKLQK